MFSLPTLRSQPGKKRLLQQSSTLPEHSQRQGQSGAQYNSSQDLQTRQNYHDFNPSRSDFEPAEDPTPMTNKERKLYLDKIEELKRELTACRQAKDAFAKQKDSLESEKRVADGRNSSLRYENERLAARRDELIGERSNLNDRIRILQNQNNTIQARNDQHSVKVQSLNNEIDRITNINKLAKQANDNLTEENDKLKTEIGIVRIDNENLRKHIFHMETSDVNPLRDEDHYIQNFCELRSELETWIARHAKSNAASALTPSQETWLLQALSGLGTHGKASSDFMTPNHTSQVWYGVTRSRIQLIRHIVAVYLFETIFQLFAAGLNPGFSGALEWMEKDIIAKEQQINKSLMIRQKIGVSAVRYVQHHMSDHVKMLSIGLASFLRELLPKSSPDEIDRFIERFIHKALSLKNAMTEEQVVYQCYWAPCGSEYNPEVVEVADEQSAGQVCLCTFPGLSRTVKLDNELSTVHAVKASVVLQSALAKV